MIRKIIKARIPVLDKTMVAFDQASGYGQQVSNREFWKMSGIKSITARESG